MSTHCCWFYPNFLLFFLFPGYIISTSHNPPVFIEFRVNQAIPPSFSHGFPIVLPWFSHHLCPGPPQDRTIGSRRCERAPHTASSAPPSDDRTRWRAPAWEKRCAQLTWWFHQDIDIYIYIYILYIYTYIDMYLYMYLYMYMYMYMLYMGMYWQ